MPDYYYHANVIEIPKDDAVLIEIVRFPASSFAENRSFAGSFSFSAGNRPSDSSSSSAGNGSFDSSLSFASDPPSTTNLAGKMTRFTYQVYHAH